MQLPLIFWQLVWGQVNHLSCHLSSTMIVHQTVTLIFLAIVLLCSIWVTRIKKKCVHVLHVSACKHEILQVQQKITHHTPALLPWARGEQFEHFMEAVMMMKSLAHSWFSCTVTSYALWCHWDEKQPCDHWH